MASIVFVKAANGTVYTYENISYWDKNSKTTKHQRKCIGHVDTASGKVVPNRKKGEQEAPLRARQFCCVMGIGVSLLLDRIAEETGLIKTLRTVFADDWQQIMTCAYYLVSEGNALSRVEHWSTANNTPYGNILTSQRVSELLTRITSGRQIEFFSKWGDQNRDGGYYAMDITSVSSYSGLVDFVRYGYNRDKEKLPQVNLLIMSGEVSHIPLYFRVLPGSIKDVSTLCETLKTLDTIDAKRLHLVMDKGFYSETNIEEMYGKHIRFLVGVPFTVGYANKLVKKARAEGIRSHENYRRIYDDEVYAKSESADWKGHRFYTHVYFDSLKAELENKKFDRKLYDCFKELEDGKTDDDHKAFYQKFFRVKETPKRGRKVEYNQEAIDDHRENTTGWFVLVTNDIKDPVNALEIYCMKDAAEKAFDDLKNDLDCKRLRIHSNQAMEGRLFIQFVALILSARIKHIMNEAGWFKNHDMQQVIDEMKSLREVKTEGLHKRKIISTFTAFQEKIIQLFGLLV
jgi:transposase